MKRYRVSLPAYIEGEFPNEEEAINAFWEWVVEEQSNEAGKTWADLIECEEIK